MADLPVADLAPLDYRFSLDAAMAHLAPGPDEVVCVLNNLPALEVEVRQRLHRALHGLALQQGPREGVGMAVLGSGLWLQPLAGTWIAELGALARAIPSGGRLAVIASQPLCLVLPGLGVRSNPDESLSSAAATPLGMQIGGLRKLLHRMRASGFSVEATYGVHTLVAMAAGILSRRAERWNRADLGDRLHFWARRSYYVDGLAWRLATTALLTARKAAT